MSTHKAMNTIVVFVATLIGIQGIVLAATYFLQIFSLDASAIHFWFPVGAFPLVLSGSVMACCGCSCISYARNEDRGGMKCCSLCFLLFGILWFLLGSFYLLIPDTLAAIIPTEPADVQAGPYGLNYYASDITLVLFDVCCEQHITANRLLCPTEKICFHDEKVYTRLLHMLQKQHNPDIGVEIFRNRNEPDGICEIIRGNARCDTLLSFKTDIASASTQIYPVAYTQVINGLLLLLAFIASVQMLLCRKKTTPGLGRRRNSSTSSHVSVNEIPSAQTLYPQASHVDLETQGSPDSLPFAQPATPSHRVESPIAAVAPPKPPNSNSIALQ